MSGGGGLYFTCAANDFDAQIFSPPYLFNADGTLANRTSITSTSSDTVPNGGALTI